MKKITRIGALLMVLLLLVGCSNQSDADKDMDTDDKEVAPETTEAAPTAETDPTVSATVPTTGATDPTVTTAPTTTTPTTPEKPAVPDSPATSAGFGAVYAEICSLLDSGNTEQDFTYVSGGISEMVQNTTSASARYSSITYALEDLDGDGKQEMIVLNSMGNTQILAIYAIQGGKPVMTREGWSRSRLYRLSDGQLYYEGSNGAAYAFFEVGTQRWFTYPTADMTDIGYYYAADGSYDPATAQQITEEEYYAKQIEFSQMISPFSVYNFTK